MKIELNEQEIKKYVQQFCNGNHDAFSTIYDLTIMLVYRTVSLLLKQSEDTHDVVQEIYIQLFHALKKYDLNRSFKLWLLGVVYKQVSSYRRKAWVSFKLLDKLKQYQLPTYDSRYYSDIAIEQQDELECLMNELSFKHRQIVILRFYNDLSQEAIAQLLNISLGTVKSRLNGAIKHLRGEYGRLFQQYEIKQVK